MVTPNEKPGITKVTTIQPEGDVNVWTKFHDNLSNSFLDNSLTIYKYESHVEARGKVSF